MRLVKSQINYMFNIQREKENTKVHPNDSINTSVICQNILCSLLKCRFWRKDIYPSTEFFWITFIFYRFE